MKNLDNINTIYTTASGISWPFIIIQYLAFLFYLMISYWYSSRCAYFKVFHVAFMNVFPSLSTISLIVKYCYFFSLPFSIVGTCWHFCFIFNLFLLFSHSQHYFYSRCLYLTAERLQKHVNIGLKYIFAFPILYFKINGIRISFLSPDMINFPFCLLDDIFELTFTQYYVFLWNSWSTSQLNANQLIWL